MERKRLCKDDISLIENYDLAIKDNFKGWTVHHRLETHMFNDESGKFDILRDLNDFMSTDALKKLNMYYYRPASELIFMKKSEHAKLHFKDKNLSESHKRKIGLANKNKHRTELEKRNLRQKNTGKKLSESTKQKIGDFWRGKENCNKGRRCYTNGEINKLSFEQPEGFWLKYTKRNK